MRTFTQSIISRLLEETASLYFFIEMELTGGTVYCTDMDIVYYYDGNPYQPADLSIDSINQGSAMEVETMDLSIQNVDQQMASYFLNYNQMSSVVTIRFACFKRGETTLLDQDGNEILDESGDPIYAPGSEIASLPLFRGLVSQWELSELAVKIKLKTELALWRKRTLRKARTLCQWPLKGTECGYSGGQSLCDHTYQRCAALSNTDNYGGFRWMADCMQQEVRWGF